MDVIIEEGNPLWDGRKFSGIGLFRIGLFRAIGSTHVLKMSGLR